MRPCLRSLLLSALAAVFLDGRTHAQVTWTQPVLLGAREGAALAFDPDRGVTVLFGGNDAYVPTNETWEWDGGRWTRRAPSHAPPPRAWHALAWDPVARRVLLFGGNAGSTRLADTWAWDGSDWTQLAPATSPSARTGAAKVGDEQRGRVVLFGGAAGTWLGDTWEWDGQTWTQRLPASSPGRRASHALAFDSGRNRVVLHGGFEGTFGWHVLADTWEWDGQDWTRAFIGQPWLDLYGAAMVYDSARRRTVLFGGATEPGSSHYQDRTWEWDGSSWVERTPAHRPAVRAGHALVEDRRRGRLVLFGGDGYIVPPTDTQEWDGQDWTRVAQSLPPPAERGGLVWDDRRERLVCFAGAILGNPATETWEWDGMEWRQQFPALSPPRRVSPAMAWDSTRGRVLLYGGSYDGGRDDTWEWDGIAWSERLPAHRPRAPSPVLADQPARGRVLLHTGNETWEWDGADWLLRAPQHAPPPRTRHALASDTRRGRVVLFGGSTGSNDLADTWEWDGKDWLQRSSAQHPPAGGDHDLAFDAARARVVWRGPISLETWEWDGEQWLQRAPLATPRQTVVFRTAYAARQREVLLLGTPATFQQYRPLHPASAEPFGTGCPGTNGTPLLAADPWALPWLDGQYSLALTVLSSVRISLLAVGTSRERWLSMPLPLDLAAAGMPGCMLHTSADVWLHALNGNGCARFVLTVPPEPQLLGQSLYQQALVLDPAANPFGAVLSNAVAAAIGAK